MFITNPVLLKNLLDEVESGKIQLPDFQRGWIWDDDRIKSLLASILRGFPVGAVMTLSSGGDIRLKTRPIEGVDSCNADSPEAFLLDGQQRLTSLYQSLRHPGPVDTHDNRNKRVERWYYIDMQAALDPNRDPEEAVISVPKDRKLTRDIGRETILDLSSSELEYEQHMMPTERLMDPKRWMLGYLKYWNEAEREDPDWDAFDFFEDFEHTVISHFEKYQIPVINLRKETPKEAVCAVFEKVNTGGVTLNVFELATASFAADAENFSLRDEWEKRKQRLYDFPGGVLQGIDGDHFLQAIALLKTQEDRRLAISQGKSGPQAPAVGCKKRNILDLKLSNYLRWADKVEAGFFEAARFMRAQYVFGQRNVPYNTQLVPLAALYVELGKELEPYNAKVKLERWYWSGVFGEMYGGTTETQFSRDLEQVAEYVRGGPVPTLVNEANFVPERLLTLSTRNSAAYKGLYALQMKNGATDWRTGEKLSLIAYDNEHVDIHHIFPRAWCEKASPSIPSRLYNSVINKTPVDAVTNRVIGGWAPSRYLGRLEKNIPPGLLARVLRTHWVYPEHLYEDDFVGFFVARGDEMLRLIGEAMGRNLGSGRDVFLDSLYAYDVAVSPATIVDRPSGAVEFDDETEYRELGEVAYFDEEQRAVSA